MEFNPENYIGKHESVFFEDEKKFAEKMDFAWWKTEHGIITWIHGVKRPKKKSSCDLLKNFPMPKISEKCQEKFSERQKAELLALLENSGMTDIEKKEWIEAFDRNGIAILKKDWNG